MIDVFLIAASLHANGGNYNEVNPGIAVRYEHAVAGVYKNSFSETSYFIGAEKHWRYGNLEYGLMVGGVTGYEYDWTVGGVTAFIAPFVTYRTDFISPTVLALGEAITLSFKVEL